MKNWNKYPMLIVCGVLFIGLIAIFILRPEGADITGTGRSASSAQAAISPAAGLVDIGLGCTMPTCLPVPVYDSASGDDVTATITPADSKTWPRAEEFEYELPGAVITAQAANGRYEVSFDDGKKGWVAPDKVKKAYTYPDILADKLAYLEVAEVPLYEAPLAKKAFDTLASPSPESQLPVKVIETALDSNANWWIKVEALDRSPCEATQDNPPKTVKAGWVPAFNDDKRTLWFYSRGC